MFRNISTLVAIVAFLTMPALVLAATPPPVPVEGNPITLSGIQKLVEDVIDIFITIVSVVVVGAFVYAGFTWVTAGGDAAKVTKAKTMLKNAAIGAVIIFGVGVILSTIADFAQSPTDIVR